MANVLAYGRILFIAHRAELAGSVGNLPFGVAAVARVAGAEGRAV